MTLCVGVSNLVWLPLGGLLSDRIGRTPVMLATTTLAVATAYPVLAWMVADPNFGTLLVAELWLSFLYGTYNGAMVAYLTEIVPEDVRTSGFSLAYQSRDGDLRRLHARGRDVAHPHDARPCDAGRVAFVRGGARVDPPTLVLRRSGTPVTRAIGNVERAV